MATETIETAAVAEYEAAHDIARRALEQAVREARALLGARKPAHIRRAEYRKAMRQATDAYDAAEDRALLGYRQATGHDLPNC